MAETENQRTRFDAVRQNGEGESSHQSLSKQIEIYLRDQILSREWQSGKRLPSEAALSEQFAASRTVVREAIRRLQGCGLLSTVNGSGTYVASGRLESVSDALNAYSLLSDGEQTLFDLLELRMAIEGDAAAKIAARQSTDDLSRIEARSEAMTAAKSIQEFSRADIEFHLELLSLSQNRLFAILGTALRQHYSTFIDNSYDESENLQEQTIKEHRRITDAIIEADPEAASEAARLHILNARNRWSTNVELELPEVSDEAPQQ